MTDTPLLSINDFSLTFGSPEKAAPVVKNVTLSVKPGEMLAIVGESGSGKSLTALSCLGLQPQGAQVSGNIRFEEQEIIGAPDMRLRALRGQRIGMIFQEPMTALNPLHTIGRQIGEMWKKGDMGMGGYGNGGIRKKNSFLSSPITPPPHHPITTLLDQVGLSHLRDRLDAYPHQLSGGERQRVMIAMAIANRPALLIADEPTTAVDVTVQAKILELLKRLQRELGMAILFITHDLTIVRRLADRVAVMRQGEIVEQGMVSDVLAAPQHAYTKHLLASEPKGTPLPLQPDAPELLVCEQLKVHFPVKKGLLRRATGSIKAVDGVTLAIPERSTLGIVGESGSGKTTLGFALLRLLSSHGRIVFMGKPIDGLGARAMQPLRKQMQVVFQDPFSSLNPRMNVKAIIEEGLLVHEPSQSAAMREAAVDAILADVGLSPEMKERYPHEFSGGQRQRIGIARAMVLKPRFVMLDEPTSALDVSMQAQIIELLKSLQDKYGLTMLFISHDLRVVRAIAQRIAVMHRGVIVEQGDAAALFANPQHDYTKNLIRAAFLKD